MPAEPKQKSNQRAPFHRDLEDFKYDSAHARELERKRNRGEVSCAECRRLKIKCDKQIPCQSCQRRGCAALCPNGSLATGQGTRFVLAATEHLHKRIAKLSGRIHQLEDALSAVHSQQSSDPHPLLQQELLMMAMEETVQESDTPFDEAQSSEVIDAFGTLSISDHGISRFFGPTGGSESLLISMGPAEPAESSANSPDSPQASVSPSTSLSDVYLFSQSFPFTPMGSPETVQDLIRGHLVPWEQACALCNSFMECKSWLSLCLTREQLMDDMLPAIYYRSAPQADEYNGPHDLALLFIVFAIGAMMESESNTSPRAEHFYQISRAAVGLQPVLEKSSIVTIQCLRFMSIYSAMSGNDTTVDTSMEMTWSLVTLAAHLSQTIGLHRESERWGLPPKMVHRRRLLFWDLFTADAWQSLSTGRPPSFSLAYIDCSFPQSTREQSLDEEAELWHFQFARECVAEVTARTLTAEAPSHATIMDLDRKVREYPLPEGLLESWQGSVSASFQRSVLEHSRETVLMHIHRSFFAQAIIEHPANPLKSIYAPSFLAAYRASTTILKSIRDQFEESPKQLSFVWMMWTFAFSAAVVFGTVVTRGPKSPLAGNAMAELDLACSLFTKAAQYSKRAKKALPILIKLKEKARQAMHEASASDFLNTLDVEDELSIFAGRTRFVSAKNSKSTAPSHHQTQAGDSLDVRTVVGPSREAVPLSHLPALMTPVQWEHSPPPLQMNYGYLGASHPSYEDSQYGYVQQPQYNPSPHLTYSAAAPGTSEADIPVREATRWNAYTADPAMFGDGDGYHGGQ